MIFTFWKAQNFHIGSSLVEEEMFGLARSIVKMAMRKKVQLAIPLDVVLRRVDHPHDEIKNVTVVSIPDGWIGVDIGSNSIEMLFTLALAAAKTVIWFGAMGGTDGWSNGTEKIAECLANLTDMGATTIIAGGVSWHDLQSRGFANRVSHISRGDLAVLALLVGRLLPGIVALDDNVGSSECIDDGRNDVEADGNDRRSAETSASQTPADKKAKLSSPEKSDADGKKGW